MPFPYYRRLSPGDKAIYRRSDRITRVRLPEPVALRPVVAALQDALSRDDRMLVERSACELVRSLLTQLEVEPLTVRVLSVRPDDGSEELHGLYIAQEGRPAVIQVWMRTAARRQVVAFRTFARTLVHELCHHLDYALFSLADSFHTEGFFKRESSLTRQLLPPPRARPRAGRRAAAEPAPPAQLDLFDLS